MSHRIDGSGLPAVHRNTTASFRVHLYQGEVVFGSRPSLGPIQPRIQWVMGALISGESGKSLKLCIWRCAAVEVCPYLHYIRHSPRCSYLRPSVLLRIICWFVTDVSGQRVGPVSKGQDAQLRYGPSHHPLIPVESLNTGMAKFVRVISVGCFWYRLVVSPNNSECENFFIFDIMIGTFMYY